MMGNIITCYVILNNMIIQDEYEAEDCSNDYLFEDDDTFAADPAEHINLTDNRLFSNHLSTVRSCYMSNKTHFLLKQDLIEHLQNVRGSRRRA